jgi:cytoskeletal protein CcmA (bactofilin family)
MFSRSKDVSKSRGVSNSADRAPEMRPATTPSVLGPTLRFKGELSADEDVIIQATVEGNIVQHTNSLTIGKHGQVKANINAAVIVVEGTVEGDLTGDDAVIIKSTGKVTGNVTVPRITLEDGASFNGRINMKPKEGQSYGVEDKADGRLGGDIKVVGE